MLNSLKSFDAYPKTLDDFKEKWIPGACISVTSFIVILLIVIGEISMYRTVHVTHHLMVDTEVTGTMDIHLNITFHKIPCALMHMEALDSFGDSVASVERSLHKTRLTEDGGALDTSKEKLGPDGHPIHSIKKDEEHMAVINSPNYCGSCGGAEDHKDQCCNTCDSVREAYAKRGWAFKLANDIEQCSTERAEAKEAMVSKEGCMMHGIIKVSKVQGAIYFRGYSFREGNSIPDEKLFDISHTINQLAFGKKYPGLLNPLDERVHSKLDSGLFQFHIKVVPTRFQSIHGDSVETNQFSVTEHFSGQRENGGLPPGVYFSYELSPIKVHMTESLQHKSLIHFFTSLCAAVGGVFTVAGLLDSVVC